MSNRRLLHALQSTPRCAACRFLLLSGEVSCIDECKIEGVKSGWQEPVGFNLMMVESHEVSFKATTSRIISVDLSRFMVGVQSPSLDS